MLVKNETWAALYETYDGLPVSLMTDEDKDVIVAEALASEFGAEIVREAFADLLGDNELEPLYTLEAVAAVEAVKDAIYMALEDALTTEAEQWEFDHGDN